MAKYLVTGIAGFIGSNLARALRARGNEVRGIDNFSTGKRENIADLADSLDFRECDLLDLDAMRHACQGIDYVLHQAAIASVPRSIADPLNSNRANVDGSLNLLVAARDAQVKRVVFAASSSALLRRITGYQGPVQHGPERAGDIRHSFADISLAEKHLGYRPSVGFEEGLQRTVAWYREQSSAAPL